MGRVARGVVVAGLILLAATPGQAQVTGPAYVFVDGSVASADEVNQNFADIYQDALNRLGGTMAGDLPDLSILPDDVPNARAHTGSFMWKLLTAWVAMGFRVPKIEVAGRLNG